MINTIIYDLDGTLIDTEELIFTSFKQVFNKYLPEVELTDEVLKSFIGPPLYDSFKPYAKDEEEIEFLIKAYREFNMKNHEPYVRVFPNTIETLRQLKNDGYNLALCTSKLSDSAIYGMELCEIYEYFDYLVCLDDVEVAKPSPEGVKKILEHFNCEDKAIMIGDNISDVLAGKNAGIRSACVSWSFHDIEHLKRSEPDYVMNDMLDIFDILKQETR